MKQNQYVQRYVLKINTKRLKANNWNLNISLKEAQNNNELITLADSTCLRFIDDINNVNVKDKNIKIETLKSKLKKLKTMKSNRNNRQKIKLTYKQLNEISFMKDYVCLVADNKSEYKRAIKGFYINGMKFVRLLSTSGQLKKSTIVFVNEKIHNVLLQRLENGRNVNDKFIPSKYNAYLSLACSSSTPVSDANVIVVKDCIVKFSDTYVLVSDNDENDNPDLKVTTSEIENNINDGFGLISPKQAEIWSNELNLNYCFSGCCVRNAFLKGMLYCFDFHTFARDIAKTNIITDIWGNNKNILDADIIITESMLKLWNSYNSYEHYHENCLKNGFTYSITKVTPKELDNVRNLNYQYLQSYELSNDDIEELIKPTIDNIKDILSDDINKTILYLKGYYIGEKTLNKLDNDFIKALMIDDSMINDAFVQSKLKNMIKKRINDAKIGVLQCNGNFSLISGDPYALCQSMFNMEVTGLLKDNEFYSNYWNKKKVSQVVAFRSPMSCHNNIRKLNLVNNEIVNYWYQYMSEVTILNGFDLTNASLNGCDFDGDLIFTTDNYVLLKNTRDTLPIVCTQKKCDKVVINNNNLIEADMNGFGDDIGVITNKITAMFDIQCLFDKNSMEYKELEYRIMCGQKFQQDAIDKIKGIQFKPMPRYWYDKKSIDEDDTFNSSLVVDKKPYFFIYNYSELRAKYNKFQHNTNIKSYMLFGKSVEELIDNINSISHEEKEFLDWYYKLNPITDNNSTMNIICHKIENELEEYEKVLKDKTLNFDYNILKSEEHSYSNDEFTKIKEIYLEYKDNVQKFKHKNNEKISDNESFINAKNLFMQQFEEKCFSVCNNKYILANIILDICYNNNNSKQFAWSICGDVFIENLLKKNNNRLKYLQLVENQDLDNINEELIVKYNGLNFVETVSEV